MKDLSNSFTGLPESKIEEALSFLNYDDQDEWVAAGMSLKSELGEGGYDMWARWSALSSLYKSKEARTRWRSFKPNRGRRIGTLIFLAQNYGFTIKDNYQKVSDAVIKQREERRAIIEAEAEELERQLIIKYGIASEYARKWWAQYQNADESHPYLIKKDVLPHGVRVGAWNRYDDDFNIYQTIENCLIIPLFNEDRELVSLQGIAPEKIMIGGSLGDKLYMKNAKKSGVYSLIGDDSDIIYICEGWATGATIHEATQCQVYVALDSGNLKNVAEIARKHHPLKRLIIAADNDQYKKSNTGIKAAIKAACAVDADYFYPVFKDVSTQPTDFNDLYALEGYSPVIEQLTPSENLYFPKFNDADEFDAWDLKFIENADDIFNSSCDEREIADAAFTRALALSKKIPAFMSMEQLRATIEHPLLNPKTHTSIMCRIQYRVNLRKQVALSSIRPTSWKKHNHSIVNSLKDVQLGDGVTLVFAPMGTGKTDFLIKPFSDTAKQRDYIFTAISHRRSLIADLANKLNITSYNDVTARDDVALMDNMAICLPSSQSTRFSEFMERVSHVAIDEISQNIRFTSSRDCKAAGADSEQVFMGLKNSVNQAKTVLAVDASIDQTTIDFFEQARPDEQFTIIEKLPVNEGKNCFLYPEIAELLNAVNMELEAGGNVWLAVESANKAESVKALFADKYKTIAVSSFSAKTKQVINFLNDVNTESKKYNLVIASPMISSGVSVTHRDGHHFTMIAGIGSGHSICFSDLAQMLARVRYVTDYHVCLTENNKNDEHITAKSILTGLRQAAALEGRNIKENEYSQFKAHIEATEMAYRADFANGFVWFLQYYCFNVVRASNLTPDYELSERLKQITAQNKEKIVNAIIEAKSIDEITFDELDNAKSLTPEESYQLLAYKLRHSLGIRHDEPINEVDVDMFSKLSQIDRFARLMGHVPSKHDDDKNITLRRFAEAQCKAIPLIFGEHDITEILITDEVCRDVIERVSKNENRFLLSALKLIPSKYGQWIENKRHDSLMPMKVPSNCKQAMNLIINRFGLDWERHQPTVNGVRLSGYRIKKDSILKMQKYAEKRISAQNLP